MRLLHDNLKDQCMHNLLMFKGIFNFFIFRLYLFGLHFQQFSPFEMSELSLLFLLIEILLDLF